MKMTIALSIPAFVTVVAATAMTMATFGDIGLTHAGRLSLIARSWVDPATLVAFVVVATLIIVLFRQRKFRIVIAVAFFSFLLIAVLAIFSASYREQAIKDAVAQFQQQRGALSDESIRVGSATANIDTRVREYVRNAQSKFELVVAMPYYSRYDYSFVEPNSGRTLLAAASFEQGSLIVTVFDQALPTP